MPARRLLLRALSVSLVPLLMAACGEETATLPGAPGYTVSSREAPAGNGSVAGGERLLIEINREMARRKQGLAVAKAEFLVLPGYEAQGRVLFASDRMKRLGQRWVPGDARRNAEGNDLSYLVLMDRGEANPGLAAGDTEAAIDRSLGTWGAMACGPLGMVKRPDTGADATIIDYYLGLGDLGDPFLADIVNAGFWPAEFFDLLAPNGSRFIIGVTFSLVFVDDDDYPTDLDRNRAFDTALAEIYYNNEFVWSLSGSGGIDVETVSLHENGHALGLGHFGDIFVTEANRKLHIAPRTVMNAAYAGPLRAPQRTDKGAFCGEYANWP